MRLGANQSLGRGHYPDRVAIEMTAAEFEALVDEAIAYVPKKLLAMVENVSLFIEEESPKDRPELYGLYVGVPLTARDSRYSGVLPDRIYIYRKPILVRCDTREQVLRRVTITVVHEVAHHFGLSDEQLHAWGWA